MSSATRERKPAEVEADIRRILARDLSAAELRTELEGIARQWAFSGFTWLWGPELYKRNRVVFRPFILGHFGTMLFRKRWQWEPVTWKGKTAEILEPWLAEADRHDDIELFRRLYLWKLQELSVRRQEQIRSDLLRRFQGAESPATRAMVIDKFNFTFNLDEPTALKLYSIDSVTAGPYILQHLPTSWLWRGEKRALWQSLFEQARGRGDHAFAMRLYRLQAPLDRWEADARALCESCSEPELLCARLDEIHPERTGIELGSGLALGARIVRLVKSRGRDVVPYVLKHLKNIYPRWYGGGGGYKELLDLAFERGWWDLWSGLLRVSARPDDWNKTVRELVADGWTPEPEIARRLLLLSGVSREWNSGGFSMALLQQLDDATAVALYERYPALVRGPFKLHLQTGFWNSLPKLVRRVVAAGDDTLIDFLASRLINRSQNVWGMSKPLEDLTPLADYFESLRNRDPAEFARRAANVLSQVPAYTFWRYGETVRKNRLARLLLERSLVSFLDDAAALRDLVEASEIHVQHLAYRVLSLDDDRAKAAAANNLDILIGTLLRPLHRSTRLAAFGALANACTRPESARRVVARARDAMALPDRRYPKEQLVGLIGSIIHRWPELRLPSEDPVIYRREEAQR
jgi:hypothetical protein